MADLARQTGICEFRREEVELVERNYHTILRGIDLVARFVKMSADSLEPAPWINAGIDS